MSSDVRELPSDPRGERAPAVIEIEGISKCFQIYDRPHDRLKQSIHSRLARLLRSGSKTYFREFWALRDVSLTIRAGETVGIIGKNGSGKSTLLQILCGTLRPSLGQVSVYGRVCALLELGSGFNPEFTGRENVYLNAAVLGMTREQTDERFADIEAFADIGDFIDQPVKQYSSGMYVRLAFAVIAHADADILIVDEALSVGDVFFGQKCMRFMREFMKRGTVVFVSHDTSAVLNLCNRVVWLRSGQIVADGDAREVTSRYLEDLYYEGGAPLDGILDDVGTPPRAEEMPRDMRQDLINSSTLRNDIEIFAFSDSSRSFGAGGARVVAAGFFDLMDRPLVWMVGGETVRLKIVVSAVTDLYAPIIGFEVYDRLGQTIFADNTFLVTCADPRRAKAGEQLQATFEFIMPVMRQGDYTVSVAVAEGTQEQHIQHHWMHEALAFHVHPKTICLGLVGVPMKRIHLDTGRSF
jgi:lipopolysaccharide transport system ATP-binding protein